MTNIMAWQIGMLLFQVLVWFWLFGAALTFLLTREAEIKHGEDHRMSYQDIIFKWPLIWIETFRR